MYWSVIAAVIAFGAPADQAVDSSLIAVSIEYVAEWIVSWYVDTQNCNWRLEKG